MENYFVHESSYVDDDVRIGAGTKVWHFCHIQSGARIGKNVSIGQNVNISNNVEIGDGVKIQNNVSVYEGVTIEDDVFLGPSCVFTNDLTPRAGFPKGRSNYVPTRICPCNNYMRTYDWEICHGSGGSRCDKGRPGLLSGAGGSGANMRQSR